MVTTSVDYWPELTDALEVLKPMGALRDLSGWEVTLVLEEEAATGWGIFPGHWLAMLKTAGAKPYTSQSPQGFLHDGEIVVFPDLVSRNLFSMSQALVNERPVLTESQLARWLWADDVLDKLGLKPHDPLAGRLFDHEDLSPALRYFQTHRSELASRSSGTVGLMGYF